MASRRSVRGTLARDTLFVGFEKSPTRCVGDRAGGGDPGWLLAIEEQPAAPRFGLDDPPDPADYREAARRPGTTLSWANVAADEKALAGLTHAPADVDWLAGAHDRRRRPGAGTPHTWPAPATRRRSASTSPPTGSSSGMPTPRRPRSSAAPARPRGPPSADHPIDPAWPSPTLDRALPLVLLPLRLEVRFWTASDPPELRVRIFPDAIHADAHRPG